MARLEDLKEGASVKGVRPDGPITIINVKWHGDCVVELTYKDSSGRPGNELLFRDREPSLGFHGARLAEMINKDGNGEYKRGITPYYLAKFIDGGVMDIHQVLNGRRPEDLPERSRMFFERMILSRKTINLVFEAKRRGIDVDKLLETILYPEIVHENH